MRAAHHVETGRTVCTWGKERLVEYGVGKKKSLEVVPSVQGGKQEIWSALSRERLELLIQSSLSLIFIYLICNREVCLGGHSSLCNVWIEQTKHGLLSKRLSYRLIFLVFILFYWA